MTHPQANDSFKHHTSPLGRVSCEVLRSADELHQMDSTPYRLPRRAMGDRLKRPSGKRRVSGDVPKSLHIMQAWWPPSAGRIAQETVVFFAVPIRSLTLAS